MTEQINGAAEPLVAAAMANPIVKMLEDLLAAARAGTIHSIGIVAITSNRGVTTAHQGQFLGDLHTGAAMMQRRLMDEMMRPQNNSRILRVGR